ncbi:hypothetical protein ACFL2F_04865 [Myxococcota bacterium]
MSRRWVVLVVLMSSIALIAGCGDPPTKVGDVCQIDDHCGGTEGTFELACDITIPGGACMVQACTADDPLTETNEDDGSCPDGSRCVIECPMNAKECPVEQSMNICRRTCDQQSDCGEVIVCRERCETVDNVEKCSIECKNEMECTPFWSPLPEDADDPPRACILKGRLFKPAEE